MRRLNKTIRNCGFQSKTYLEYLTEDDAAVTPPSTEAEVDPDGDPFDRDLLGGDNEAVEVDAAKAAADEACHKV